MNRVREGRPLKNSYVTRSGKDVRKGTIHVHVLVAHVHGVVAVTYLGVHVLVVLGPVRHGKHSTGRCRSLAIDSV